ncbi:MAG: translation initiation factor IF-2 [Treponema sp.]|nr:translation initiation factor IF-2 [Spirochaetales bacterium]MDY5811653.1 translation initiation factor IF-2 [Treponema sp.]
MAEESEKKSGAILIKHPKTNDAQPVAEPQKKKKIVIKRKAAPAPAAAPSDAAKGEKKKRVVVQKKHNESPAKNEETKDVSSSTETKAENTAPQARPVQQTRQQPQTSSSAPAALKPRPQAQTLEYPSTRPNVKAGNLSGGSRGGYNRGNGGYNRGGYNNGGNGGFTGAQAREGYQNRERQGGYNRGGYNNNGGQGGYNRGGYNNNGGQGGYNRGGQNGGFNRGEQGGQGGYNRGSQGGFNRGGTGFGGGRPGFGGGRPSFAPASAVPAPERTAGKKQFKGKKQVYNRKDKEEFFDEDELYGNKKHEVTPASVVPETIDIMETISVSDLAKKMNLKASEIIGKLMGMGMMVTINQSIDSDTATILAEEYNCKVHLVSLYDETVIASDEGSTEGERTRPPVVTVMGHVDHGKTKTLDAIRNENVAAGEAGGITQKIGAYQVRTKDGHDITFLDTPGHEAFTMMRARGAQITDIVVLVVAADDGVMPQTMEAINHAKDAKVPIIVAVNKCDKPDANPENVMTQLSNLGLTPEAWGGDTQFVNISALKHEGIDDLLDAILIQAEMLELKAQYDCRAEGKVIESRTDQGRGVVASVIVERGTLRIGDPIVAGIYSGRVRAMFNDRGQKIKEATPSMPVEVLGLESMPNAGDPIQVTENEKDARAFAAKRQELKRFEAAKAVKKITLDNMFDELDSREVKELKLIIKADLQGSAEALKTSLEKLSTREIRVNVIHSSAGAINESDVTLAAADQNAIIIGFNVRPTPKAKDLADQEKVEIRKYNIIYKCVEEIQQAMEGMLSPDTKEETTGTAEVRNTFKVPKVGVIAGCYVTEGLIKRTCSVNLIRDGVVIFSGKISSLKRFKDDAKEVKDGFECGIGLENWQDIQVGDQIEAFEIIEVKRSLGKTLEEEKNEAAKKEGSEEKAE